jgi:lipopolysaccharide transport system ATP-binding protein
MNLPAIRVEHLSKAYRLGVREKKHETLVQAALAALAAPVRNWRRLRRLNTFATERESDDILWALRDVSFDVAQGEVVGLVGRNGAGKSTLLKVLSRITEPTEGRVVLRGRVSSLLEVGTGFHPELTGRENVYMNGTILGMRKREIDRKFDEIVEFSGVERFLDTPVKRYSSGMKVRLAFSVAAHLEPEVLIVDEVLAVGDAEFQKKCLGKMQNVAGHGRTVLFVSHNMAAIQTLCPRAVALRNGRLVDDGESGEVIRAYLAGLLTDDGNAFALDHPDRNNTGRFHFTAGRILDQFNEPTRSVLAGEPMAVRLDYECSESLHDVAIGVTFFAENGVAVTHVDTHLRGSNVRTSGTAGTITCVIPRNPLALGTYRVAVSASAGGARLDLIPSALVFSVTASVFFETARVPSSAHGSVYLDHEWSHVVGAEPREAVTS